jgi:hypothetical protein
MVEAALTDTRVVLVNSARQAGKMHPGRVVAETADNAEFRSLDQPQWLSSARDDPTGFVQHDGLLIIDEVQRQPDLFLPLKYEVDTDPRPGRFLLTGSARVLGLKELPDTLPGRMERSSYGPCPRARSTAGVTGSQNACSPSQTVRFQDSPDRPP